MQKNVLPEKPNLVVPLPRPLARSLAPEFQLSMTHYCQSQKVLPLQLTKSLCLLCGLKIKSVIEKLLNLLLNLEFNGHYPKLLLTLQAVYFTGMMEVAFLSLSEDFAHILVLPPVLQLAVGTCCKNLSKTRTTMVRN